MVSLHGFCQSGNTFKVALTLNCLKQPWTPVFVDFMNGATLAPQWRESVNEMGEVPVLEVDGRRMTRSGAMPMRSRRSCAGSSSTTTRRPTTSPPTAS